jgi:hypothetical protein
MPVFFLNRRMMSLMKRGRAARAQTLFGREPYLSREGTGEAAAGCVRAHRQTGSDGGALDGASQDAYRRDYRARRPPPDFGNEKARGQFPGAGYILRQ